MKVAKLEKVLEALEGTDGVEVDAIKKALVKANVAAHEKPVSEQIEDCRSFIDRAEKRLVKLDAERESEQALLEEGRARLARLETNVAASVLCHPQSQSWCAFEQSCATPQPSPGGFRPQHCGRGCIVDAMQAARHGGRRDCPRFRRGCFQAGACHRRGSTSVDTTTLVSGEHGELSHVSEVAPASGLCTVCGVNVSARQTIPAPPAGGDGRKDCVFSSGPWTAIQSLRTSVAMWQEVGRRRATSPSQPPHMDPVPSSPPSEVIRALEADLCCHPRASRRAVLAPKSPGGTPQSVPGSPTGAKWNCQCPLSARLERSQQVQGL